MKRFYTGRLGLRKAFEQYIGGPLEAYQGELRELVREVLEEERFLERMIVMHQREMKEMRVYAKHKRGLAK